MRHAPTADRIKVCHRLRAVIPCHEVNHSDSKLCRCANASICGSTSGIRNGFVRTRSIPVCIATAICSLLAFAVTAMTGTCARSSPSCCISRIRRTQLNPSITGISRSISRTDSGIGQIMVPLLLLRWMPSPTCSVVAKEPLFLISAAGGCGEVAK